MYDYGNWNVVLINSLIFIIFAFSFVRPKNLTDWRVFGTFSAFIVALFTEMYGFPLTIYFLSGWLSKMFPQLTLFSHNSGHIWYDLFGLSGDPHNSPIHVASTWLINGGLFFLAVTWIFLYKAQRKGVVAKTGPYFLIRHPQYAAFIVIMFGFLLQWPTLLTVIMFPILVVMYIKLAKIEESESIKAFGEEYIAYANKTGRFIPRVFRQKK
ncbi:isoprenylcysteine carboxylmethyltransferase family protein [Desulfitobacterium sp.]|uniref:methyltransferase family protein n=1 Tax=Desulfitobacterium sp. TaxID=49981 RepID=UPI002BF94A30|nr:isoprenylcysteine carboxylmethyltransferase family protein [Desulfitobacterium sp.]HVJ47714.1 isoprenylcysteine carboxylmethyltransferase family protein [Desulfitobacterium sp.]